MHILTHTAQIQLTMNVAKVLNNGVSVCSNNPCALEA